MSDLAIVARSVTKHFPVKTGLVRYKMLRAVDKVDIDLAPGEVLGIVGESGCGKTTLGRILSGLIPPTGGEVRVQGRNLFSLSGRDLREYRRQIQVVFQDPQSSLNPRMTVNQAIQRPLDIFRVGTPRSRKAMVAEVLGLVGLRQEHALRYPHELSGGQKQRVSIARVIILKPSILILDEPTSALDVSVQAQILNLLVELKETLCLGYVFISHNLAVIRHISDRVAVMYLGKIVESASVDEIFNVAFHPYTQALMAATPDNWNGGPGNVVIEGEPPSPVSPPNGCYFSPRCPLVARICREEFPPPRRLSPTHEVMCYFPGESFTKARQG